ncbi:MAG: 50S ribosomal protein L24 [Candidatus Argoarchaeum ethanivorans]|uniref:Large ribosomal subunit protein uL24 n=1 Tax=Candidatus Argoarchaeum ethanivorans TaxID=2608793 RepID=A0A811T2M3_9EURY|nr:MAG: 50S ribosomal protein L24 [Candidatus Argoarchaeum ethanivorans]
MIKSKQPRKQRKALFTAPLHQRNKQMSAMLESGLSNKHNKNAIPVLVGDTVKVMRGDNRDTEGKVVAVNYKKATIAVEGVVSTKSDGTEVGRPIHPSNVMITKLNLDDTERENILRRTKI